MPETFMMETTVKKIGQPEHYVGKPVVKDGIAIGVISNAEETEEGYKLSLLFWKSVGLEFIQENGVVKPSALCIYRR